MRDHVHAPARALRRTALIALLLGLAACASAGGRAVGENPVQVTVSNDLTPSMSVTISAAVEGATPERLGSVVAGAEQTFTYSPLRSAGTFRLVADRPGPGGALVSEPIPLPIDGSMSVQWELSTNNIIVR